MLEDALPFVIAFAFAFAAGRTPRIRTACGIGTALFWALGTVRVWASLGIASGARAAAHGSVAAGGVAALDIGRLIVTLVFAIVLGGAAIVFYRLGSDI